MIDLHTLFWKIVSFPVFYTGKSIPLEYFFCVDDMLEGAPAGHLALSPLDVSRQESHLKMGSWRWSGREGGIPVKRRQLMQSFQVYVPLGNTKQWINVGPTPPAAGQH